MSPAKISRKGKKPRAKRKRQSAKDAAKLARLIERRAAALQLRKQGASYRQIAEQMRGMPGISKGYSEGLAFKDVTEELRRALAANNELADEMIRLEGERLDWYLSKLAPQIAVGDLYAIDRALKISDSRCRMFGLNKPVKIAPTTPDGNDEYSHLTDEELNALILKMVAEQAGGQS